MSRDQHYGGGTDRAVMAARLTPRYRVSLWNPNRARVADVVLGRARSPEYDLSPYVVSLSVSENVVWENNDDAVSTNASLVLLRDHDALPIPIDETTLVDGAPVRAWVSYGEPADWILIFTGVVRGRPSYVSSGRKENQAETMSVMLVGREEAFLNRVVTARSYEKGTDVGKAAVETAIEYMGLDAREIRFGKLGYSIGHDQSQLVDIEVLKGIYQMLSCVGKKPRFDAEGLLIAADTDLGKPPARRYSGAQVLEVRALQQGGSLYNSVRLLGLSNAVTEVEEGFKRIAHGEITAGWFVAKVKEDIYFSEAAGKPEGGRRAKYTRLWMHMDFFGELANSEITWAPTVEADGYTTFGGRLTFDTGFAPWIEAALVATYVGLKALEVTYRMVGNAALVGITGVPIETSAAAAAAAAAYFKADILGAIATAELVAMILAMQSMGRVTWAIWGIPFTCVFVQLCSMASLDGVPTADQKTLEVRNDWLYDITYMDAIAKELLKRELVKGWAYEVDALDDPLVETDDVVELPDGSRHYVTSVKRAFARGDAPQATMSLTTWRLS